MVSIIMKGEADEILGFRCSFRVSIEVLLVMRFEQRANSWPHHPSERLGEGV